MTIEFLRLEQGVPVDLLRPVEEQVEKMLADNSDSVQILPEGYYSLETGNGCPNFMRVLGDGSGVFNGGENGEVRSIKPSVDGYLEVETSDNAVFPMPPRKFVTIVRSLPDGSAGVFGIVHFTPGPNPGK